jgi:murein DD-endopeptidase MepM/ murein hydrolase activator NlpD
LFLTAHTATAHAEAPPRFGLPVECEIGPACFVQNYVDHRRGQGYKDYHCGSLTNNGHGGTDFRLPGHAAMFRGVAVVAAAAGTVKNVRDGMPDVDVRLVGRNAVDDRGLGNAVIIDHGGGWRTIYGHMRRNSVAVKQGQPVDAGQKLGMIGLSGLTEFPRVHFEVRFAKRIVDPFVGLATHTGCDAGKNALWRPDVLARLSYRSTFLLSAGFSDRPLTKAALQYGLYERDALPAKSGSLYFGIFVAGLYAGDRYTLRLFDIHGKALKTADGVIKQPAAVKFRSVALKRNVPLPEGAYRARFTLHGAREGMPPAAIEVDRTIILQ